MRFAARAKKLAKKGQFQSKYEGWRRRGEVVTQRRRPPGVSCDNEWVPSLMGETELNEMVKAGILPDRITAGWRPADGKPYSMPHTNELVVFEDYF